MTSAALPLFFMGHNTVIHISFSHSPRTTSFLQSYNVWVMPIQK